MGRLIRKKIGNEVYINSVRDEKFKSDRITVNLITPLDRKEATVNALVPFVLRKGCKSCPDFTELNKRLYKTSNYDSLCIVYQSAKWLLTNDGTSLQSTYFPDSDYASFLSTIFSQKERALYSFPLHFSNSTSKALVYVQPLSSRFPGRNMPCWPALSTPPSRICYI